MEFNIIIFGMGFLGSNLSKELARFLAFYKNNKVYLSLVDNACVTEKDVYTQTYLKEDIGWNKAAVMADAIKSSITGTVEFSRYLQAYNLDVSKNIPKIMYKEVDFTVVCDCTGNIDVRNCLQRYIDRWKDKVVVISCTDAIYTGFNMIPVYKKPVKHREMDVYYLLAQIVNMLTYSQINDKEIALFRPKASNIRINQGKRFLFICVGVGGTGGDFAKQMMSLLKNYDNVSLLLIDGDRVEEKNLSRQPFNENCILQNKADILREGIIQDVPEFNGRIFSCSCYIDTLRELNNCIATVPGYKKMFPVLVGCVDNHRARQVMEQLFVASENIIYLDSGNEFDYGEVVSGIRIDGEKLSPSRSYYFPDVLTDTSPTASELSCGIVNVSSPQHQLTNLYASAILLNHARQLVETNNIFGGITYFDVFSSTVRAFQPEQIEGVVV